MGSSGNEKVTKVFSYAFMIIMSCLCIYPLLLAVSVSFSDELLVQKYGYSLIPMKFSLGAYKFIINEGWIVDSYLITIFVTVFGTLLSMIISSMLAYTMAMKNVKFRNYIAFYVFFILVFQRGLVPFYLFTSNVYKLNNNLFALILPYLINPWYVMLLKNYFQGIPDSMAESATIDGAHTFTIFWRIILPLSKPILATVGLFIALIYWNDWWLALLFISQKTLYPLQYQLFTLISNILFLSQGGVDGINITLPRETIKMATTIVAMGPIILLYPLIQKYFIKGIMVGAIKG